MPKFHQNQEITYVQEPAVRENCFLTAEQKHIQLPVFETVKNALPAPYWQGHGSAIDCYYKAWEIAFSNIRNPQEGTKFVSPFIDAAFNGCIFMWDSVFMLMFGKYAGDLFNFQQTLDNFYAHQHKDGFISREIRQSDSTEKFTRFDPSATGPNVMPWCEWEYYLQTGDGDRVKAVFPPLLAYHRWLKKYHTWRDGGYFSSGWGCGMDNQPRLQGELSEEAQLFDHGHMVWVDACIQQIMSCNVLIEMAQVCGREEEIGDIIAEKGFLTQYVNDRLWDEDSGFYYDLWPNDQLSMVKTIAGYWALLAGIVPTERLAPFAAHLENPKEFNRPFRVPTLSADHPKYQPTGGYWLGSVWAPTNYMVLRGLRGNGLEALAHEIGLNALENVVEVFRNTGTLWENYAPETAVQGRPAMGDFVGWSGIFPITVLFEYVFGIEIKADRNEIIWNIRLTDAFGVSRLPIGSHDTIDLQCDARECADHKPKVQIRADRDMTVILRYGDSEETVSVKGTKINS